MRESWGREYRPTVVLAAAKHVVFWLIASLQCSQRVATDPVDEGVRRLISRAPAFQCYPGSDQKFGELECQEGPEGSSRTVDEIDSDAENLGSKSKSNYVRSSSVCTINAWTRGPLVKLLSVPDYSRGVVLVQWHH
eukprot:9490514-Pyramimonas_sp.AAC.1